MKSSIFCFLIDDDLDDHEIFELAVKEIDKAIHCIFARDGEEALEKLSNPSDFVPNYIFLDLNMPRMSGRELLRRIRTNKKLTHVPIVIYTTSSEARDVEDARSLGANEFITKPPYLSDLTRVLTDFFSRYNKIT